MKLLLVLDCRNYEEIVARRDLVHDGGKLLKHILDRLSILQNVSHTYIYPKTKQSIPTKKQDRLQFLYDSGFIQNLKSEIKASNAREIVAMGSLACEVFTGASRITEKEGTCWRFCKGWQDIGYNKVWVSLAPDACLFDAGQMVNVQRVLRVAAIQAGIEVKPKLIHKTIPFCWDEYI